VELYRTSSQRASMSSGTRELKSHQWARLSQCRVSLEIGSGA